MSKKYNFVYKTTNNINGDYYYGVHSTNNLDDGYLGSGKRITRSMNKYGESNFTREIVQYFSNVKNAYILERVIVTPELISDPHCLNIAEGGHGGNVIEGLTEEEYTRMTNKQSVAKQSFIPWNKNKHHSKEHIKHNVESRQKSGKHKNKKWVNKNGEQKFISQSELELFLNNGWLIGRGPMPEEQKQKISISEKGKKCGPMSEEHRQKLRKPKSEEHKQKLREANIGKHWKIVDGKRKYF